MVGKIQRQEVVFQTRREEVLWQSRPPVRAPSSLCQPYEANEQDSCNSLGPPSSPTQEPKSACSRKIYGNMRTGLPKAWGLSVAPELVGQSSRCAESMQSSDEECWPGRAPKYQENCPALKGSQGELPVQRELASLCVRNALGSEPHLQVGAEHPAFPSREPAGNSHSV